MNPFVALVAEIRRRGMKILRYPRWEGGMCRVNAYTLEDATFLRENGFTLRSFEQVPGKSAWEGQIRSEEFFEAAKPYEPPVYHPFGG